MFCSPIPSGHGGEKRALDSLKLELPMVVCHYVGTWNWTQVLCKNNGSQLLCHFSGSPFRNSYGLLFWNIICQRTWLYTSKDSGGCEGLTTSLWQYQPPQFIKEIPLQLSFNGYVLWTHCFKYSMSSNPPPCPIWENVYLFTFL